MPTTKAKAATTAKRSSRKKAVIMPAIPKEELTPAQQQAKLEAYNALKSAGLDVPIELAQEVETWIAAIQKKQEIAEQAEIRNAAKVQAAKESANAAGPWYVRNCYVAPFNLRLDRQTERRRIELKPRGVPGDLHPIKDEDLKDPVLKQNVNLGLIEIVPAGEATQIIDKQTTNISRREHTPISLLRNAKGEQYTQGNVKVEAEFNSQGVTVATVDPRLLQGHMTDIQVGGPGGTGGIQRVQPGQAPGTQGGDAVEPANSVVSGFVPTGGREAIIQYGPTTNHKIADDNARRKDLQGPQAGIGDLRVVVNGVQKS